jgi:hypothetical protein
MCGPQRSGAGPEVVGRKWPGRGRTANLGERGATEAQGVKRSGPLVGQGGVEARKRCWARGGVRSTPSAPAGVGHAVAGVRSSTKDWRERTGRSASARGGRARGSDGQGRGGGEVAGTAGRVRAWSFSASRAATRDLEPRPRVDRLIVRRASFRSCRSRVSHCCRPRRCCCSCSHGASARAATTAPPAVMKPPHRRSTPPPPSTPPPTRPPLLPCSMPPTVHARARPRPPECTNAGLAHAQCLERDDEQGVPYSTCAVTCQSDADCPARGRGQHRPRVLGRH